MACHLFQNIPRILYNLMTFFCHTVKGVSEKIERLCHPLGIRATLKSQKQMLMKLKSTRPAGQRKGVIYEVPCADCDSVYVGETGRSLEIRLKEHCYAVRTRDSGMG